MGDQGWRDVAERQAGLLARWQLRADGPTRAQVRHQIESGRWLALTRHVLVTTTGPLAPEQLLWRAVLHAGPGAMLGGLTAARQHGLSGWDREGVTVLVRDELSFEPLEGVRFFRTRRDLVAFRSARSIPTCRLEPALLLFAGYWPRVRTAHGAVAASIQQGLSTAERYREWLLRMKPLRGSRGYWTLLADIDGGSHSMSELDVVRACREGGLRPPQRQVARTDRDGRRRYTDCEWDLPGGRVLVLEIDGGFHREAAAYALDMRRQRKLTTKERIVVRCAAEELRYDPAAVIADLIALGVGLVA